MVASRVPARAIILDVDGTVSAVHPTRRAWGDEMVAGNVFGPVLVSPRLCARLDDLARQPGVSCWWLTSWTSQMRARMDPFPGRGWPVVAEAAAYSAVGRRWWKLTAVEHWLERHPEVHGVAWCDDSLRGGRPAAVRRRLRAHGIDEALVIAPATEVGLTPEDLDRLGSWARG